MKIRETFNRSNLSSGLALSWASSLMMCTVLTPVAAIAQQSTSNSNGTQVQEIVVTAQRRAENLQDTPVAVSAFSAQTLKTTGVTTIKDLGQVVPSLQVSATAGVYIPFIRGVGNNAAGTVGNESSVATYIDDVYYTHLSTAYLQLGDIDRVEVLNGPQGTLFGRNSSGGAIQMFTRDPSKKTEVDATVGYANYETVSGQFYASIPLTNTLAWNIAVAGSDQEQGWGHSITTGQPQGLGSFVTVRSKLLWEPTEQTRVKVVGFYAHSNDDFGSVSGQYQGTYGLTANFGKPTPGYPFPPVVLPSLGNDPSTFYDTRLNSRNFAAEDGYGGSVRVDQDLGFADFVSISSGRRSRGNYHLDLDFSPQNLLNVDLHDRDDEITQEFQLKSKSKSTISWILGAYYLHAVDGYDPADATGDLLGGAISRQTSTQTINSYSGYGQATAPVGYRTNLTLGLRLTEDRISATGEQDVIIPGVGTVDGAPAGLPNPFSESSNVGAFTYRVALDHHFTDDLMAYASVSRGYKSGAFNTLPVETPAAKPEIVQAYEVGLKSELFERRLRLNGALFWNDLKNPQVLTTVSGGGTANLPVVSLTNAQAALSRGVELGFDAVLVEGLNLRGGVTYDDAHYTKFNNAPIFSGGMVPGVPLTGPVAGNGAGNQIADDPKWRFTAGGNYTVATSAGKLVGDVGISYSSRFPWTADNHLFQKSVTLVNASLSFSPTRMDRLTFSVWGKNLGNVHYYAIGQESVVALGTGGYVGAPAAPLTVGGSVSVKY